MAFSLLSLIAACGLGDAVVGSAPESSADDGGSANGSSGNGPGQAKDDASAVADGSTMPTSPLDGDGGDALDGEAGTTPGVP